MSESGTLGEAETPLLAVLRRGVDWFCAQQDENFLHYSYHVVDAAWSEEHHAVREMAALWSIARAAKFFGAPHHAALANRGLDYFESCLAYDDEDDFAVVVGAPHAYALSYNAFLILALLESKRPDRDDTLAALARGILHQQNPDGKLRSAFYSDSNANQQYFPGQAMLALMALFAKSKQRSYLDCVERAFRYYRDFWRAKPNTPMVPWHSQALYSLHRVQPNPDIADFVFEMNDYLLDDKSDPENPERFLHTGVTTAVYIEGLSPAYLLAREYGDRARQARYARYVHEGAAFVMRLQCPLSWQDPAEVPAPALGGFHSKPTNPVLRVDHNQHAVMALIGALEAGLIR